MTAIQSPLSPSTVSERRTDPSMEEILASIRKIIAEEDTPAPSPPPSPAPVRNREAEEQRLAAVVTPIAPHVATPRPAVPTFGFSRAVSTPAPTSPKEPAPAVREPAPVTREAVPVESVRPAPVAPPRIEPVAPHVEAVAAPPRPVPEPIVAPPPVASVAPAPVDVGPLVSAAATESIASAFQALTTSVALTNSDTIDRHVRELLRPMLRTWLDDNLPVIVEKLVRIEIERVARGGR